jgi:putative transposase
MPRIARGRLERGWFHVLNRGNHRQMLFHQPDDYAGFLQLLTWATQRFKVRLWGYCLMGNHWHLVVEVEGVDELSRWVHAICNRQVRLLHRENQSLGGGHIYQGRYKSFPIQDEAYLFEVLRYVEANPLRAKLVDRAEDWPWSSLSRVPIYDGLVEVARPELAPWVRDEPWHQTVNRIQTRERLCSLQQSVVRGTPQGQPDWVAGLAAKHGLESTMRPRGRPRKLTSRE